MANGATIHAILYKTELSIFESWKKAYYNVNELY